MACFHAIFVAYVAVKSRYQSLLKHSQNVGTYLLLSPALLNSGFIKDMQIWVLLLHIHTVHPISSFKKNFILIRNPK